MKTVDYASALADCLARQHDALQRHRLDDGESVWVRRAASGNPRFYYILLEWLTVYVLRVALLRPVHRGSRAAIDDEARRLRDLARDNIPAPRLLAVHKDGLMMSDLGAVESLDHLLRDTVARGEHPFALWRAGAEALFALHARGQYLSQAFARNIVRLPDGTWAFIDFEEDPARVLEIAACQVRDRLLFLHSTAHYLPDLSAAADYWRQKADGSPAAVLFADTVRRLAWTRHLRFIRHFGRDGRRLARALRLLAETV